MATQSVLHDHRYAARFTRLKAGPSARFSTLQRQQSSATAALVPERKSKPKKALIAIITTLATGFLRLLFVFVRRAVQNAGQDLESAAKLAAVRDGLGRVLKS